MTALGLLAALNIELPKQDRRFGRASNLLVSDVLLILGVGAGLLLVLCLIAYLWMKSRRKRRRHISGGEKVYRVGSHSEPESNESVEDDAHESHHHSDDDGDERLHHSGKRRYKYRVRRRSHRSRNPTLSEVGGLPPVKTPESGKPC